MIGFALDIWQRSVDGGTSGGGPFLLQTDGVSHIKLVNNVDRLLIIGHGPSGGTSGQSMGLLLALTYP